MSQLFLVAFLFLALGCRSAGSIDCYECLSESLEENTPVAKEVLENVIEITNNRRFSLPACGEDLDPNSVIAVHENCPSSCATLIIQATDSNSKYVAHGCEVNLFRDSIPNLFPEGVPTNNQYAEVETSAVLKESTEDFVVHVCFCDTKSLCNAELEELSIVTRNASSPTFWPALSTTSSLMPSKLTTSVFLICSICAILL